MWRLRRGVVQLPANHPQFGMHVDGEFDHLVGEAVLLRRTPAGATEVCGGRGTLLSTNGGLSTRSLFAFFHTLSGVACVGSPDKFFHAIYIQAQAERCHEP